MLRCERAETTCVIISLLIHWKESVDEACTQAYHLKCWLFSRAVKVLPSAPHATHLFVKDCLAILHLLELLKKPVFLLLTPFTLFRERHWNVAALTLVTKVAQLLSGVLVAAGAAHSSGWLHCRRDLRWRGSWLKLDVLVHKDAVHAL